MTVLQVVRAVFQAFVEKDRAALEPLIAADFRFFSPPDPGLDRDGYFERCWPASEQVQAFRFVREIVQGDTVVITYESGGGRNTEIFTVRGGQVHQVEVYFGWEVSGAAP